MTGTLIAECVLRIAAALALLGFSGCTSDAPLPSGSVGSRAFTATLPKAANLIRPPRSR